jgi:replicative DNA helicase
VARETPRAPGTHVPPHDADAEEAVLGAMLVSRGAVTAARSAGLEGAHFYRPALGAAYAAICALDDAGEPVDKVTVAERLRADGVFEEIGGIPLLVGLLADVPAPSHAGRYAEIVVAKAAERAALGVALEAVEVLRGPGDTTAKLARVGELWQAVEPPAPAGDPTLYGAALELLEVLEHGEARLATGIGDLDALLAGGLAPGSLTIVGARPAMGKSAFVQQVAEHAAEGVGVLFCSAEMGRTEVALRAVEARTGLSPARIFPRPSPEDLDRIVSAMRAFARLPLHVHDGSFDLARIASLAEGMRRTASGLGLVVVDYLQLLTAPAGERREREVAGLSTGLKRLARRLEVPVLAVAQLSRSLEGRADKRPVLADLRESGQLEQDADVVLFLYRDEVYNPDGPDAGVAEVQVAKNRHGPTGRVHLHFRAERVRFAPLAPDLRVLPGGAR